MAVAFPRVPFVGELEQLSHDLLAYKNAVRNKQVLL